MTTHNEDYDLRELTEEAIATALADSGIENRNLVARLVEITEGLAEVRIAKTLGQYVERFPETPGGEAIVRHMMADDRESIRSAARRIGCADSSLLRAERQLARFLGLPKNHAAPSC